ncbi:MAG: hypothetical protein AAB515_02140 [Patescibacteria group bacterium]
MTKPSVVLNYRRILTFIIFGAAAIRFVIAPQTSIESRGDTLLFQLWGYSASTYGLTKVYEHPIEHPDYRIIALPNYLPPYLMTLHVLAQVHALFEPATAVGTPLSSIIFKTPAILFELATILLLAHIVRRRWGESWALGAAVLYAANPAMLFTTAAWGQVDAINTFFMVLCVWLLTQRKLTWAVVAFTAAFFIKLQSLALAPLLAYAIFHRWPYWRTLIRSLGAGLGTAFMLCLPFVLTGKTNQVFQVIAQAKDTNPVPSANAFNLWWFFSGGYWTYRTDVASLFGMPMVLIGAGLFFSAVAFAVWFRSRAKATEGLWLAAAFLAFAFFMLPTQMHERYLFPFFALLIPALPAFRPARWLYVALSCTFLWNLVVVFIILTQHEGTRLDNFWGGSLIVAMLNVAIFAATVFWYTRMARRRAVT